MYIGVFGVSGCGKSTLVSKFKEEGFPACIDVNIKNVSFKDIDESSEIDFRKKHYLYEAQDASHAGFESYFNFDVLILGQFAKAWVAHLPIEVQVSVLNLKEYQFAVFHKTCEGNFNLTGIIG